MPTTARNTATPKIKARFILAPPQKDKTGFSCTHAAWGITKGPTCKQRFPPLSSETERRCSPAARFARLPQVFEQALISIRPSARKHYRIAVSFPFGKPGKELLILADSLPIAPMLSTGPCQNNENRMNSATVASLRPGSPPGLPLVTQRNARQVCSTWSPTGAQQEGHVRLRRWLAAAFRALPTHPPQFARRFRRPGEDPACPKPKVRRLSPARNN